MSPTSTTNRAYVASGAGFAIWLALVAEWSASGPFPDVLRWVGFSLALGVSVVVALRARRRAPPMARSVAGTALYCVAWQWLLFASNALGWDELRVTLADCGLGLL